MKQLAIILIVLAFIQASSALATTYVVRPDGTGDFPTIQAAINAVVNGDSIELANGTFTGAGNRDIDYLGKAIVIRSQGGDPDLCIIDCQSAGRGFCFQDGEGAASLLEGVTVTRGSSGYGGGVFCYGSSSPTLRNCAITSNSGGGLYCHSSAPSFTNCTIASNTAGGVWIDSGSPTFTNCAIRGNSGGGVLWSGSGTFTNCHIDSNSGCGVFATVSSIFTNCSIHGNSGGGVYCDTYSSPTFAHCTISANSTDGGGGVYCAPWCSPAFSYCTISGNSAGYYGGGVCCWDSRGSFDNCTLSNNSAPLGGGIWCNVYFDYDECSPGFTNCTISHNSGSTGGGLYCEGNSSPILTHCTVSGNSASNAGGGVYCSGSSPIFNSTIIAFSNGSGIFLSGSPDSHFGCCDIFGNSGGDIGFPDNDPSHGPSGIGQLSTTNANGDSTDIYHNVFLDPLFVSRTAGDFHLTDGSHCIGAADPMNPPPTDMDGNPRPNPPGSNPDIGAYEHALGTPSPSAGYVELLPGPPWWGYRLYWVRGSLSRLVFADLHCGALGYVFGDAAAAGWMASDYVDSVVFTSSTPLTFGSIDVFWLEAPPECLPGTITWTAGDSSGTIEGPLPVELTTFQAVAGDGQVTLRWRTESELDNSHFVLYKRKAGEEDFRVLTEIPGHGTTTEAHDYNFVDRFVQNGLTYEYRISDVDITGRETIHEQIISATLSRGMTPLDFALYPNYPNPFNPTTTIRYDVKEAGLVTLKVFDLLGREVATLVYAIVPAGSYSVNWDASALPSGVYLCRMEAERFQETRKIVLLK